MLLPHKFYIREELPEILDFLVKNYNIHLTMTPGALLNLYSGSRYRSSVTTAPSAVAPMPTWQAMLHGSGD